MQGTCGGFLPGNWKKQNREEETEQGCNFGKVPSISVTAGGALECKLHHDVCAPLGHSRPFILLSLAKGHTSPVIVIISVHAGRHTPRYFWLFMPHHKVSSVAFKQCSDESSRQLAKEEEGQQQNQTSPNTVAWGRYIETANAQGGVGSVDSTCYIAFASQQPQEAHIISTLERRKLKHRKVNYLAYGHTAGKQQTQDSKQEARACTAVLHFAHCCPKSNIYHVCNQENSGNEWTRYWRACAVV